jgi:hypothetical protein
LFHKQSYNVLFLGVNSESEAKLSSFNKECLALGFEEELRHLMRLSSPSEALTSTELGVKEVSSAAKMLADAGDTWNGAGSIIVDNFFYDFLVLTLSLSF